MTELKSGLLLNPRMPETAALACQAAWARFVSADTDGIGVLTSGSTAAGDTAIGSIVVLSRLALEASAESVNRHLQSTAKDVWGLVLPTFHVGGYGILQRAKLSGARVTEFSSGLDAPALVRGLIDAGVTLTSMVPTQIFDIVRVKLAAPPKLRALIVGGGALSPDLTAATRALGWPVLRSYGMSECASQIATEGAGEHALTNELPLLAHVEARINSGGRIELKSPALLTAKIQVSFSDAVYTEPVQADGWFESSDRGQLAGRRLTVLGRDGDVIKIVGELVDVSRLRARWEKTAATLADRQCTELVALTDPRRGHRLVIAFEAGSSSQAAIETLVQRFNSRGLPFERIDAVMAISQQIPRSPLGKVLDSELRRILAL